MGPLGLLLDPHPVCDSCDVVEVAHDLDRVRDRGVVEALSAEHLDVALVDLGGIVRQLHGEVAQRPLARRERRQPVIVRCMLRDRVVCALGTEVVCMRDRSIVAALLGRGHGRQELALAA
jgi:hypothetical protein